MLLALAKSNMTCPILIVHIWYYVISSISVYRSLLLDSMVTLVSFINPLRCTQIRSVKPSYDVQSLDKLVILWYKSFYVPFELGNIGTAC
uniref:AlNc14C10G1228 protein n=1 Tax=Albugo laibachii Nc14 TaxID=890382 RepID=F0W2I1_9STRA|nr:AlNc14C10G1228 [Albugo laibachii Nc14]|eukprot:CCA15267.1 AlNc14C10G1228 [Albugo laibachii Nc14]